MIKFCCSAPFRPSCLLHYSSLSSYSSRPSAPVLRHATASSAVVTVEKIKNTRKRDRTRVKSVAQHLGEEQVEDDEEEEFQVLTAIESPYNQIVILDTPKSRLLILDSTNNVHSMLNKESKWTGSYWEEFATLPPIIPQGPIAIYGLGGATAAHLMLELWPSLQLEGWDIDGILIEKSREFLGLSDLEKHNIDGGVLNIHIGDAFSSSASVPGGYAGIIVDLFADGKVLPQLEEADTWIELKDKLMPNGRFMVNCAGENILPAEFRSDSSVDGNWRLNDTIKALDKAFPGQVNWKKKPKSEGANYLALTGSLPDLSAWDDALPAKLKSSVYRWRSCS